MSILSFFKSLASTSTHRRPIRRSAPVSRLCFEPLENRRLLTFAPLVYYGVGTGGYGFMGPPSALASADFNGDGRLDLAAATSGGRGVGVLLGNGNGTFQSAQYSETGGGNSSLVADLNGDAKSDLLVINNLDLEVLLGNGDGTFQSLQGIALPSQLPPGAAGTSPVQRPTSAAVADLNADGKLDLVAVGYDVEALPNEEYRSYDYVNVLLGDGGGTFGQSTAYYGNRTFGSVLDVRDFDGDGKSDVLTSGGVPVEGGYGSRLSVLVGNGDGTLQTPACTSDLSVRSFSTVADFDGDGKLDVLSQDPITNDVSVVRGNGDGTFLPTEFVPFTGTVRSVGDINKDGNLDIVGTVQIAVYGADPGDVRTDRYADVLVGDGAGSFAPDIGGYLGYVGGESIFGSGVLADFDSDGFRELALPEFQLYWNVSGSSVVAVAHNDGNWTPSPPPPNAPSITMSEVTVTEGNAGTRAATFTVTLTAASSQPVMVDFSTADGTATAGSDYQAVSGKLTFAPGETNKIISVLVNGDRVVEWDESFFVNLSGATNATIADGQGLGIIKEDDPRITIGDVAKYEGKKGQATLFTFEVTLSVAYDQPVTMSFRTANGTATTSDGDYVARSGTLTFAPGETTKTITVSVKGDTKQESDERFYVNLSGASGAQIDDGQGEGTIVNDDSTVQSSHRWRSAAVDAAFDDWMSSEPKKRGR